MFGFDVSTADFSSTVSGYDVTTESDDVTTKREFVYVSADVINLTENSAEVRIESSSSVTSYRIEVRMGGEMQFQEFDKVGDVTTLKMSPLISGWYSKNSDLIFS